MEIQIAKDLHNKQTKDYQEYENMNMALTDRFLSMLAVEHSDAYYTMLITEPNRRFGVTFQYFYDLFGDRDEREIEINKDNMKQPWNTQQGFQFLKARFQDGTNFAAFAKQPIKASDVLNMLLAVILNTGLFQLEYTEWHTLPENQ